MKKRNLIVTLMLSMALVASAAASVFAYSYKFPGHPDGTPKLESVQRDFANSQEGQVEAIAVQFNKEVKEGKYKLVDTATLNNWMTDGKKMVIVDTMGKKAKAYPNVHIKGAIETWAPLYVTSSSAAGEVWGAENGMTKAEFLKAVGDACKVNKTYYWNTSSKKWVTKKPAAKNWGECTKKGDANKGKKQYTANVANKKARIVVYCGFVGCGRSHEGAKLLVENGYTNVYRYGGGISAWYDAGYPIEGVYTYAD